MITELGTHVDRSSRFDLVVIAASLGGPAAYADLIRSLPADFAAPIVLVQHRVAFPPMRLAEILQRRTELRAVAAADGEALLPGTIYVAPATGTTIVRDGRIVISAIDAGRRAGDRLFESAAEMAGDRLIAVILTGTLVDGAAGARAVKAAGGRVLVQTPREAQASGMPLAALGTGCVDHVLSLRALASALSALVMSSGAADLFAVPTPHWTSAG